MGRRRRRFQPGEGRDEAAEGVGRWRPSGRNQVCTSVLQKPRGSRIAFNIRLNTDEFPYRQFVLNLHLEGFFFGGSFLFVFVVVVFYFIYSFFLQYFRHCLIPEAGMRACWNRGRPGISVATGEGDARRNLKCRYVWEFHP